MNAADIFKWIVIGGAVALVFIMFLWSINAMTKMSDESSERYWEENFKEDEEKQDSIEPPKAAGDI